MSPSCARYYCKGPILGSTRYAAADLLLHQTRCLWYTIRRGRATKLFALPLIAILLVFSGCGDTSLLLQIEPGESVRIESLSPGSFVAPGETVPFALFYDETLVEPESLEIRLFDAEGVEVVFDELSGSDLIDPPSALALPALREGRYLIEFTLYDKEGLIAAERIVFFYTGTPYILRSITSFPSVAVPGASALFIADLDVPDGKDPYLRWRTGSEVLLAGYSSEGALSMQFAVPEDDGVYPVSLELFPEAPREGETYDFISPLLLETQVFVSSSPKEGRYDLSPRESYYSLFHFLGEMTDYAANGSDRLSEPIGIPGLAAEGSLFGYLFDGTGGVLIDGPVLPPGQGDSGTGAFSLSVRGALILPEEEAFILRVFDGSGETPFFSLSSSPGGTMKAVIGGRSAAYDAVHVLDGGARMFTLSFIPNAGGFELVWYVDGLEAQRNVFSGAISEYPARGRSIIAGIGGAVGLIDELGVYFIDSDGVPGPDPDVYADAMNVRFGSRLLYANGFDGARLPAGGKAVGTPIVRGGRLIVPPGVSLRLASPLQLAGSIEAEITVSGNPSGGTVSLVDPDSGAGYFEYRFDGTVTSGGEQVLSSDGSGSFTMRRNGSVLDVTVPGDSMIFSFELPSSAPPVLLISNSSDSPADFEIDSILLYRLSRSVALAVSE